MIDPDLTSHKFALFVPEDDDFYDEEKLSAIFSEFGADEIKKAEF